MVIGQKFVWAHMGKTGGDSVHKMFAVLSKKHIVFADDTSLPDKHFTFQKREAELQLDLTNERERILNIRRLPSWVLSYGYHKEHRQGVPFDKKKLLEGQIATRIRQVAQPDGTIERVTDYVHIDQILQNQMCGRVDYWLRTEFLADDFVRVIGKFVKITFLQKIRIRWTYRNINHKYQRDLSKHFTESDLKQLYASCPFWAEIEKQCYGNIIEHI